MNINAELFPTDEPEAAGPRVYSVRELTGDVRAILEAAFDAIWVDGEISNLRQAQSGHCYFVLKDDKAQIRCVMFRNARAGMKYRLKDGDRVLVSGRVTVYEARGEYQIIVDAVEPKGLGALQRAFEELKAKLKAEGLFDEAKKKEIPAFPCKVGVVTSATGAAVRDILQIIRRRNPAVSVLLHPVKVQGEGAAGEIAAAIAEMNRRKDIDVLIVGRGGGSIEDLWGFNEEVVARAIHASKIPLVSAVGHEIDFTIADFAADLRAPTPSAAAELVVPVFAETVRNIRALSETLVASMQRRVEGYRGLLKLCIERRFFREPLEILEPGKQRLDDLNLRLARGLDQWVARNRQRLESRVRQLLFASPSKSLLKLEDKRMSLHHQLVHQAGGRLALTRGRFEGVLKNLHAVSPLAVLERGYSITTREGRALRSSGEVKPGETVEVRLGKGGLECTVDKTRS
jgi:exodeoxyribonuclease VII large subunit